MSIKLLPGVFSAALGLAGTGAVVIAPNQLWIGYGLIAAAALLFLWGIRVNDQHFWASWPDWLSRNIWWRFGLRPPRPKVDAVLELPEGWPHLAPIEHPAEKKKEYPYPYRKALLKVEVGRPHGIITSQRLTIPAQLRNDHTAPLMNCSVVVRGAEGFGNLDLSGRQFRVTNGGMVQKQRAMVTQFGVLRRDISDSITPEPFLLMLDGGGIPLNDNSSYVLELELRTEFPHPTIATIQVDTLTELKATVRVVEQHVEEESAGDR